jgi:hypothetical protein
MRMFLIVILFNFLNTAYGNETPNYCQFYPNFDSADSVSKSIVGNNIDDQFLHNTCVQSTQLSIDA